MEVSRRGQRLLAAALGSPAARRDVEKASELQPITAAEVVRMRRFFRDVAEERGRQLDKWGEQHHPSGTSGHNFRSSADAARRACQSAARNETVTWFHIAREEFWEAMAETDTAKLRTELVQLAAVCAAWVSDIDQQTAASAESTTTADEGLKP